MSKKARKFRNLDDPTWFESFKHGGEPLKDQPVRVKSKPLTVEKPFNLNRTDRAVIRDTPWKVQLYNLFPQLYERKQ